MGNRSNIVIEDGTSRIYLYSHWEGQRVIASAMHGLNSGRVGDPAYLARIVFENMIEGYGGENGFGISTELQDNEHRILVLSDKGVYFDGLTEPVSPESFKTVVEGFDWKNMADQDELYEPLIGVLKALD